MRIPSTMEIPEVTIPINSEYREPYSTRVNTSLP